MRLYFFMACLIFGNSLFGVKGESCEGILTGPFFKSLQDSIKKDQRSPIKKTLKKKKESNQILKITLQDLLATDIEELKKHDNDSYGTVEIDTTNRVAGWILRLLNSSHHDQIMLKINVAIQNACLLNLTQIFPSFDPYFYAEEFTSQKQIAAEQIEIYTTLCEKLKKQQSELNPKIIPPVTTSIDDYPNDVFIMARSLNTYTYKLGESIKVLDFLKSHNRISCCLI